MLQRSADDKPGGAGDGVDGALVPGQPTPRLPFLVIDESTLRFLIEVVGVVTVILGSVLVLMAGINLLMWVESLRRSGV